MVTIPFHPPPRTEGSRPPELEPQDHGGRDVAVLRMGRDSRVGRNNQWRTVTVWLGDRSHFGSGHRFCLRVVVGSSPKGGKEGLCGHPQPVAAVTPQNCRRVRAGTAPTVRTGERTGPIVGRVQRRAAAARHTRTANDQPLEQQGTVRTDAQKLVALLVFEAPASPGSRHRPCPSLRRPVGPGSLPVSTIARTRATASLTWTSMIVGCSSKGFSRSGHRSSLRMSSPSHLTGILTLWM